MPKKIDPQVEERCTRLVLDHLAEYPSLTAACTAVAQWHRDRRSPAEGSEACEQRASS